MRAFEEKKWFLKSTICRWIKDKLHQAHLVDHNGSKKCRVVHKEPTWMIPFYLNESFHLNIFIGIYMTEIVYFYYFNPYFEVD